MSAAFSPQEQAAITAKRKPTNIGNKVCFFPMLIKGKTSNSAFHLSIRK